MTYIEDVPFHYVGKGEQCIVKTRLALSSKKNRGATVLLIEEPENHLSHSKLNQLISDISTDRSGKQVIMTTHSSFVANKLGLDHLILLREAKVTWIKDLDASRERYQVNETSTDAISDLKSVAPVTLPEKLLWPAFL